ncbi:TOBE domain-containing protein [Desulfohalovibrio reitneri]|uniref:TOBE domain-containing protein n=1 Tax=Desulfohalovibrio reitneri TaxID=1307759 RepID=UPI00068D7EAB|nr:TOBE domain-containing protein [Desulfohalovibrio reitneri]
MDLRSLDLDQYSRDDLGLLRERIDILLSNKGSRQRRDASNACRLFTVADGVRWLDARQLEQLRHSFANWMEEARDGRTRQSRERVFLAFLILRFTGARLGEVLALNEREHIDYQRGMVLIPDGDNVREVPVPPEVTGLIRDFCVKYGWAISEKNAGERIFDLDQGFLRRKFSDQVERCDIPRELLNPRVLRNSRAIELLQGGMPMRAVQSLLGHSRTDYTANFVTMTESDLRHVIQNHCAREFEMETSARNTFQATVTGYTGNDVVCEVRLRTDSGYEIASLITEHSRKKLGLEEGRHAVALVKATWVILEKWGHGETGAGTNAFPGVVEDIASDGVAAEVSGRLDDGTGVCALITEECRREIGFDRGDSFLFRFQPASVILS